MQQEVNYAKLGMKIKSLRLRKGLTQDNLAEMVSCNTSHISNIENNRVKISLPTLVHVCNALDTTIDYILADEYDQTSSVLEQEILHELHSCTDRTKKQILEIVRILRDLPSE